MKSFDQMIKETDTIRNDEYKQKKEKEKFDREKTDRELLEAIEALRQTMDPMPKRECMPKRIKAWVQMMSLFQFMMNCIDDPDVFDDEFIQEVSTSVKAIAEWHKEANMEKKKKKKKIVSHDHDFEKEKECENGVDDFDSESFLMQMDEKYIDEMGEEFRMEEENAFRG